jgi:hypothetical protein
MNTPRTRSRAAKHSPVLDNFCSEIADILRNRDGARLQDFLQVEPPLPIAYDQLVEELRRQYPKGDAAKEAELEKKCETLLPKVRSGGSPWIAFPILIRLYLRFLRDVNVDNLLETYELLKGLVM